MPGDASVRRGRAAPAQPRRSSSSRATRGLVGRGHASAARTTRVAIANSRGVDAAMGVTSLKRDRALERHRRRERLGVVARLRRRGIRTGGPRRRGRDDRRSARRTPARSTPGDYTVVLAPEAVSDLLDFLGYLGFGAQGCRREVARSSPDTSASSSSSERITHHRRRTWRRDDRPRPSTSRAARSDACRS